MSLTSVLSPLSMSTAVRFHAGKDKRVAQPSATYDARPDSELVELTNGGDVRAFEALYFRHRDFVVKIAVRFTRDHHLALDVLQEVFAYWARKFPGFELRSAVTTFLYPAARNAALAQKRKRRELTAVALPETPHEDPPAEEWQVLLKDLPEIQREVVMMRFVDDMTMEEIGEALGIPAGTVKSRLHTAIAKLRETCAEFGER